MREGKLKVLLTGLSKSMSHLSDSIIVEYDDDRQPSPDGIASTPMDRVVHRARALEERLEAIQETNATLRRRLSMVEAANEEMERLRAELEALRIDNEILRHRVLTLERINEETQRDLIDVGRTVRTLEEHQRAEKSDSG